MNLKGNTNIKLSRRKGRYVRRKKKRYEKIIERNLKVGTLDEVFNFKDTFALGKKACNGVRWKNSTQRFETHLFSRTATAINNILADVWKCKPYYHFALNERGKTRLIDAPHINDRQVHKVLTRKVLLKLFKPHLIYDNGASLKGKGFDFSVDRLIKALHKHYRKYGRKGWIILIDFKQYFPSASHDVIMEFHDKVILDNDIKEMTNKILKLKKHGKGLPLGVEPSQAEMISYAYRLDSYIACQLGIKSVGHYMDDYRILIPPDRNPKEILELIIKEADRYGITINRNKTRIVPLDKPFKYCKHKFLLTETGKVIVNGSRKSYKIARRKIKAFKNKIEKGEMSYENMYCSMNSILNYFSKYNDHKRLMKLKRLFYGIYSFPADNLERYRSADDEIVAKSKPKTDEPIKETVTKTIIQTAMEDKKDTKGKGVKKWNIW